MFMQWSEVQAQVLSSFQSWSRGQFIFQKSQTMNKQTSIIVIGLTLLFNEVLGQAFKQQFNDLVLKNDTVGQMELLKKWEKTDNSDPELYVTYFNFYMAKSKKDFIAKLSISLKEAKETHYWLRLLFDCDYLNKTLFDSLLADCNELISLLTKIIKTARENELTKK